MQHLGAWRWGDPYSLHQIKEVEVRRAALSLRQKALKNELLQMRHQQLVEARKERREELRAQVQQLELQVRHYELKVSTGSPAGGSPVYSDNFRTAPAGVDRALLSAQSDQRLPGSRGTLVERLVQQNEQIMALLLPQRYEDANALGAMKRTSTDISDKLLPLSIAPSKTDTGSHPLSVQNSGRERAEASAQHEAQREVQLTPTFQAPAALSWLPEFQWTDEDELALNKLENDADTLFDMPGSGDVNNAQDTDASANTATTKVNKSNAQKARDRIESRKKLEAILSASLKNAGGGALRKPRWRLEAEAESDDVAPFEDTETMEPLQVFRSTILTVLFTIYLKKILMEKKLAEKESAMRDFESMLRIYFDATRMWLGKVVRTPLLSLLQDSSLDVDISTRSGLAGSSLRGFAKKFGGILARRPPPPPQSLASSGQLSESTVNPAKLLKLKVRMKGILQALSKAIDKKDVPSGILDFWKRISTDGVYFPPSYQLFNEERRNLEFDALGATRRMDFDGSTVADQDGNERGEELASQGGNGFSRFNVVVINFLLVRVLIPHVILQPWNVGIGPKHIGRQASANLASLATLLYCVCRQLSALPPPVESETSFLGRRRSKTVATLQANASDESSAPVSQIGPAFTSAENEHNGDTSFLSMDEIGRRLISDKNFPCNDAQVIQVVKEHQVVLQETMAHLRSQLHGSQEEIVGN